MKGSWPQVRLGEVLSQDTDYIESPEPKPYSKLSVKLYGKGVVLDAPTDGAMLKMKRHQIAKAGQVILSEIWGKKGAIGFVPTEGAGALCTSHFFLFDVQRNKLDPEWLRAIFIANYLQEQLEADAKGTTGYAAVRPRTLLACEIPLPPLREQRRVVARIEELAAKIAEARLLREQTLGEVEALHSSAVSSALDSMRLQMKTVEEMVGRDALRNGKSVKPTGEDGAIRCLTLKSMRRGRIDLTQSKPVPLTAEDARQFAVRRRDVFIVRGNGSKHLCGQAGLVEGNSENVVFPDLFIRVPLPETLLLPEFFVAVWNSGLVRAEIEDKAKTTSGIWKINQTHIASTRVPVPSLAEQHRLVTYLDGLDSKADALKLLQAETAAELDAMLPAILDRAFKGEL